MNHDLPSPSAGLAAVIQAAGDPETSAMQLGRLIASQPSLSASLLGLANTPAYGPGRTIRSVEQATAILGTRAIRNIAVTQAVRVATAKTDSGEFDDLQFWEDSLRRATAGLLLARVAGYEDPPEAFTVGLIQDLGTLAMAVRFPKASGPLQSAMRLPAAERLLGVPQRRPKRYTKVR